jgi:hypothetical protein
MNESHSNMFHTPTLTPTVRPLCQTTSSFCLIRLKDGDCDVCQNVEQLKYMMWLNSEGESYISDRCCRNLTRTYNLNKSNIWHAWTPKVKVTYQMHVAETWQEFTTYVLLRLQDLNEKPHKTTEPSKIWGLQGSKNLYSGLPGYIFPKHWHLSTRLYGVIRWQYEIKKVFSLQNEACKFTQSNSVTFTLSSFA